MINRISKRVVHNRVARLSRSIADWCSDLIPTGAGEAVPNHVATINAPDTARRIRLVPQGGKLADVEAGYGSNYRRLDPRRPSWTVTATCYSDQIHPTEDRLLTSRELARLQSFPDQWRFVGPRRGQQGKRLVAHVFAQIGNAVPPLLAYQIGAHLRREVFGDGEVRAVSLFSGAGGMDIGLEAAGIAVRACVEYDRYAAATLRANRRHGRHERAHEFLSDAVVLRQDISRLPATRLLRAARLGAGEVDLVFGGPPCQAFSHAGEREGFSDHRGLLVNDFLRMVAELSPRVVVFENVKGIRSTQGGAALAHVKQELERLNFGVTECLLNAAHYGVAQQRERVFLLCVRDRPRLSPPPATHAETETQPSLLGLEVLPLATVGEALAGLPAADEGGLAARRVAETICARKEKQDWAVLRKKQFAFPETSVRLLQPIASWLKTMSVSLRYRSDVAAACILAVNRVGAPGRPVSIDECLDFMRDELGAVLPEKARDACGALVLRPLVSAGMVVRSIGARGEERFRWNGPDLPNTYDSLREFNELVA